jgi:hypothetical protein
MLMSAENSRSQAFSRWRVRLRDLRADLQRPRFVVATRNSVWTTPIKSKRIMHTREMSARRSRRERHSMCNLRGTAFALLLLWTVAGWAQSVTEQPAGHDSARKSKPNYSSLLARSEMQQPKPLPITRPLRFQEIPVTIDRDDLRQGSISIDGNKSQRPTHAVGAGPAENDRATAGH